jgi:hypothetical protein
MPNLNKSFILHILLVTTISTLLSGCGFLKPNDNKTQSITQTTQVVTKTETNLENNQANQFADLQDVETAGEIEDLNKLGVFNKFIVGNEFKPYEPITRAEYISWLYTAYNTIRSQSDKIRLAPPNIQAKFSDVPSTNEVYKYIQALANAGYSVGYEDGTFKPDQPITREELIAIKVGLDSGKASQPVGVADLNSTWGFADSKDIDKRYSGYIYSDSFKYNNGGNPKYSRSNIIRAFGKLGTFKPKEPVLRHEAAATLWQVDEFGNATAELTLKRIKEEKEEMAKDKFTFTDSV